MTTRTSNDKGQQRDTGAKRPSLTLSYYVTNGVIVTLLILLALPVSATDYVVETGYSGPVPLVSGTAFTNAMSDGAGGSYGKWITTGDRICSSEDYARTKRANGDPTPESWGYENYVSKSCGLVDTAGWHVYTEYSRTPYFTTGPNYYFYYSGSQPSWLNESYGESPPTVDVWVEPSGGQEPLSAMIHFTVTGNPTPNLSWQVNDPDGVNHGSGSGPTESVSFQFDRAGTWTVFAWATNTGGSANDNVDVVITPQSFPPTVTPSPAYTLVPNVTYATIAPQNISTLATIGPLATPSEPSVPGNITSGYIDTINGLRDMTNSFADVVFGKLDIPFLMINGFFETVTQELAGLVTAFSGDAHAVLYLVTKTMNSLPSGIKLLISYALCGDLIVLLMRGET